MVYFQTKKIPIFGAPWNGECCNIFWTFVIFYNHWVYLKAFGSFLVIWYIFVHALVYCTKTNLADLFFYKCDRLAQEINLVNSDLPSIERSNGLRCRWQPQPRPQKFMTTLDHLSPLVSRPGWPDWPIFFYRDHGTCVCPSSAWEIEARWGHYLQYIHRLSLTLQSLKN
jgi:hypothetical protein